MLGTKTFIVLSSDTAVKDLLDRRSNIYSSRPDMFIGMDLASGGLRILLMVRTSLATGIDDKQLKVMRRNTAPHGE